MAQSAPDGTELLLQVKIFGENTRSWRAEVIQTTLVTLPGLKELKADVHMKLAAQPSMKMSRVNSGDDRTTMVCDGAQEFYSGDGLSYYLSTPTGQCNFSLFSFYEPSLMNFVGPDSPPSSVSVVGEDHVQLTEGDRRCLVVRVELKQESMHAVRTMCIDPARPVILRDAVNIEDTAKGFKSSKITTFVSFEENSTFAADSFQITIPPHAYRAYR